MWAQRALLSACAAAFHLGQLCAFGQSKPAEAGTLSDVSLLFKTVSPSVIRIEVKDEREQAIASGSGFVIGIGDNVADEDLLDCPSLELNIDYKYTCTVATNFHVISTAVQASVRFGHDGEGIVICSLAEDEAADVAVLKVATNRPPPKPLMLALDRPLDIGTTVITVGSPEGLQNTLSNGLVSGMRTSLDGTYIQITAPISSGSSGGPVLAMDGTVIGMATMYLPTGQNLNFAIPASMITKAMAHPARRALASGVSAWWQWGADIRRVHKDLRAEHERLHGRLPREEYELKRHAFQESEADKGNPLALLLILTARADSPRNGEPRTVESVQETLRPLENAAFATSLEHVRCVSVAHCYKNVEMMSIIAIKGNTQYSDTELSGYAKTFEWLARARKSKPMYGPALLLEGQCYIDCNRFSEALASAEMLTSLMPRCPEARQLRAKAFVGLRKYEAAIKDYEWAVSHRPRNAFLCAEVAEAYLQAKRPDKSIELFKQAVNVANDKITGIIVSQKLADVYLRVGLVAEAVPIYEKLLQNAVGDEFASRFINIESTQQKIAWCKQNAAK